MGQPTHKQASLFGLSGKSSKVLTEKPEQTPQCLVPGPIQPPPPRGWFTGNPAAASCVSPADTGPLPGSLGNGRPGLQSSRGHRGRSGPFTASCLETAVDELGECVEVCVPVLPDTRAGHHRAPGNTVAEALPGQRPAPASLLPPSLSLSVWGLHVCA